MQRAKKGGQNEVFSADGYWRPGLCPLSSIQSKAVTYYSLRFRAVASFALDDETVQKSFAVVSNTVSRVIFSRLDSSRYFNVTAAMCPKSFSLNFLIEDKMSQGNRRKI